MESPLLRAGVAAAQLALGHCPNAKNEVKTDVKTDAKADEEKAIVKSEAKAEATQR